MSEQNPSAGPSRPVEAQPNEHELRIKWQGLVYLVCAELDRLLGRHVSRGNGTLATEESLLVSLRKLVPVPPAQSVEAQTPVLRCYRCKVLLVWKRISDNEFEVCRCDCGRGVPAPPADTPAPCKKCAGTHRVMFDQVRGQWTARPARGHEHGVDCPDCASDSPVLPDSSRPPFPAPWPDVLNQIHWLATRALAEPGGDTATLTAICTLLESDAPAVADTRDPSPEEMLRGASELEAIAEGIRGAVAGRVTPFDPDAAQLDTREREWRVASRHGSGYINGSESYCRLTAIALHADLKYSDDGGKIWVDADTPSDKEKA